MTIKIFLVFLFYKIFAFDLQNIKANMNTEESFIIEDKIIKGISLPYPETNSEFGQIFLNVFDENPEHIIQMDADTGNQTTFAEMKNRSIRCAVWLKTQNLKKGDIVAMSTNSRLDEYIPLLASFYVGLIYNPWHHEQTLESARYFMKLIKPKIMFCTKYNVEILQEAAKIENLDVKFVTFEKYQGFENLNDLLNSQSLNDVQNFEPVKIDNLKEDIAYIAFSSGTSGFPKGVMISYESVKQNTLSVDIFTKSNDKNLWYSTPFWSTSIVYTLLTIKYKYTRILHQKFDVNDTLKVIENYGVNFISLTPTMISYFVKSKVFLDNKYNLKSIKRILTVGDKVNPRIFTEFKETLPSEIMIFNAFGMTELGGAAVVQTNKSKISDSIGFVIPNVQLKIVDINTRESLGPNKTGEILFKKPIMMLGYYNNPTATKEAFNQDGWLKTGDIGYFDETGEIVIVDRIKDVFKYQNYQVSPTEIENLLLKHPDVLEAAVAPVPDEIDTNRPMAFVKKRPESKVTQEELFKMTLDELGKYKALWGGVQFVDEIPKTPSGKIERKKINQMAKAYIRP